MTNLHSKTALGRREVLKAAGIGALALTGAIVTTRGAQATADDVAKATAKFGTAMDGKITIDMPPIAENGASVPVNVTVDSPMTAADHVKAIHIFAEGNPSPEVISFNLTASNKTANVGTRMRMGKTQNVVVVAVMSDGKAYSSKKEVKVTIGGCGG